MGSYISAELRRLVAARADYLCEYCLIHEQDRGFGCHVDHIIAEKHGGKTEPANLAYACAFCNRSKGSNVGSVHRQTGALIRLYNPRIDTWSQHFRLDGTQIAAISEIGEVTVRILRFNDDERCLEREVLRAIGRYPCAAAALLMAAGS